MTKKHGRKTFLYKKNKRHNICDFYCDAILNKVLKNCSATSPKSPIFANFVPVLSCNAFIIIESPTFISKPEYDGASYKTKKKEARNVKKNVSGHSFHETSRNMSKL